MHRLKSIMCIAVCAISLQAGANDSLLSEQYHHCMDRSEGVTMRMIECFSAEHQRQDLLLNKVYQQVMSGLSTTRKTQLRNVQRQWMAYRDANCQFYADPEGGSLARIEANACMMQMTAERAAELQASVPP
ncbi:MAG: lysozyme inhibitor LprI family protein [Pseudomonadota bacterium]|nr:lysozyme inhibitor LprI family protein [Pseudomonadota bacterium]